MSVTREKLRKENTTMKTSWIEEKTGKMLKETPDVIYENNVSVTLQVRHLLYW